MRIRAGDCEGDNDDDDARGLNGMLEGEDFENIISSRTFSFTASTPLFLLLLVAKCDTV